MKNEKKKIGYLEGWVSILINTALFVFKFIAGMKSHSIAVVADAWHTLSDSFTSLVVIIGFWLGSKPADREHPFGHGMIENISSIIIATLLGGVGITFFIDSIKKILAKEPLELNIFTVIVFLISVLVKEALAQFSFYLGKKIDSGALRADGWHHRSDAIASLLILAGVFTGKYLWWIDGALGIVVSILIVMTAKEIIFSSSRRIIGEEPDENFKKKVEEIVSNVSGSIKEVHHIHLHDYGDHKELTLHIRLPNKMSVEESHNLTKEIESAIHKNLSIDTTVHVEPEN